MQTRSFLILVWLIPAHLCFCQIEVSWNTKRISSNAELWWARAVADIDGDGLMDVVLQNNNGHGGWLGWLQAQTTDGEWKTKMIAQTAPNGEPFSAGDLDAGDIDHDGDIDVLGIAHPGEWDNGGAPSTLYWYENPSWKAHPIGTAPDFIKDVNLADLNGDGNLDLVTATYIENNLTIFRQDAPDQWKPIHALTLTNLHEGMDVGDIDGDGDIDIVANGYWIENPGENMEAEWRVHVIDEIWHNQEGDWSRNATKVVCRDIDGDNKTEVFITHSERKGYPLALYRSNNPQQGEWEKHVIQENMTAAHTLQVNDFDRDGDFDVLSGWNRSRAQALGESETPIFLFLNPDNRQEWKVHRLSHDGIYNGQAADFDGDGDIDFFHLPTHDAHDFYIMLNTLR